MNPKVDIFLSKAKKWQKEMEFLRSIMLESGMDEELKWYKPCYSFQKTNLIIIAPFKDYCSLAFFNGALLKDEYKLLVAPGENTQSGRQIRFTELQQIIDLEPILKSYIAETIENEKKGLKVELKKTSDYPVPEELQIKFEQNEEFKVAFEALTPGRQRAYLLYFAQPKQSNTRESRIEKFIPMIFEGKGFND